MICRRTAFRFLCCAVWCCVSCVVCHAARVRLLNLSADPVGVVVQPGHGNAVDREVLSPYAGGEWVDVGAASYTVTFTDLLTAGVGVGSLTVNVGDESAAYVALWDGVSVSSVPIMASHGLGAPTVGIMRVAAACLALGASSAGLLFCVRFLWRFLRSMLGAPTWREG